MPAFNLEAQTLNALQNNLCTAIAGKDGVDVGDVRMDPARVVAGWPQAPYRNQVGFTCGLYGLRNVMRYYFKVSTQPLATTLALAPQIAARKIELRAGGGRAGGDRDPQDPPGLWVPGGVSLRELAKRTNLTAVGELLHARYVAQLAVKVGYRAAWRLSVGDDYLRTIKDAIDRDVPPVVSVDARSGAGGGNAIKLGGQHGHWVVAFGYQKVITPVKERDIVFIMHWGKFYAFSLRSLMRSSNQLQRFPAGALTKGAAKGAPWNWTTDNATWSAVGAPTVVPSNGNYIRRAPVHGVNRVVGLNLTDVSGTLNGAIVEVEPETTTKNTLVPHVRQACNAYREHRKKLFHSSSAASKHALGVLEAMVTTPVGLNLLLDAVIYYTTPTPSARPDTGVLGNKLKQDSKFCTLLKGAYSAWEAWLPTTV